MWHAVWLYAAQIPLGRDVVIIRWDGCWGETSSLVLRFRRLEATRSDTVSIGGIAEFLAS